MTLIQSSEPMLISQASQGDLESFNELVLMYQPIAYRYACSLTRDSASAEDIAQESFIKAFQNIRSFRGGSFRAWLLKIITNTARDQWRRFNKRTMYSWFSQDRDGDEIESPIWVRDPAPAVEIIVEQHETSAELFRVLDDLPSPYRSAITLIDLHELEYAEAAKILDIPIGTLKSRLARARMQMAERVRGTPTHNIVAIHHTDPSLPLGTQACVTTSP